MHYWVEIFMTNKILWNFKNVIKFGKAMNYQDNVLDQQKSERIKVSSNKFCKRYQNDINFGGNIFLMQTNLIISTNCYKNKDSKQFCFNVLWTFNKK
jgi:hypothetical protein